MFSLFDNVYSKQPREVLAGDPFDILQNLFEGHEYEYKTDAPLISPSIFHGNRSLENHIQSEVIGLDIDGKIRLDKVKETLNELRLGYYIYTTASSRNLDRFRVFLKLDAPITSVEDYRTIWLTFNGIMHQALDDKACHAASLFYIPARFEGADNKIWRSEGASIEALKFAEIGRDIASDYRKKNQTKKIVGSGAVAGSMPDLDGYVPYDPSIITLETCPFVKPSYVDDYLGLKRGDHYTGLYSFMCRVAGHAKARGAHIAPDTLAVLARQLDQLDGLYYFNRRLEVEARRASRFIYGGAHYV